MATGILEWSPQIFWTSTSQEVCVALEGWKERHLPQKPKAIDRNRLNELIEERQKNKGAKSPPALPNESKPASA